LVLVLEQELVLVSVLGLVLASVYYK